MLVECYLHQVVDPLLLGDGVVDELLDHWRCLFTHDLEVVCLVDHHELTLFVADHVVSPFVLVAEDVDIPEYRARQ